MNARLYDPVVGRFLSPDPYIQSPDFSQNFNRYSYGLNNPLRYTDENGEFIFTALAAVFCPPLLPFAIAADIGMIINVALNLDDITKGGGFHFDKFAAYALVGAGSGVAVSTGNFYCGLVAFTYQGGANQFVRNDFKFSGEVLKQGGISAFSFVATAGLTSGIPGISQGVGLDKAISKQVVKAGFGEVIADYTGEFVVNSSVGFATGVVETAVYQRDFDWGRIASNAFGSATFSLGISVAKKTIPSSTSGDKTSYKNETDRAIKKAQNQEVQTPASSPKQQPKNPSPNYHPTHPLRGGPNDPLNNIDILNILNRRRKK